ncbi:MAG TPA: outer membrane beta-barrel protein [Vicinamibacterales bacterium]|nr:outer membrane beta-barrel protein [Vicinamibacterales bacterium]
MIRFAAIAGACIAWSATAVAQTGVSPSEWSRCTTLNAFVGASGDTTQVGTAVGGAIGWDITPSLAIEGAGAWTEFGHDTTGFSGSLKVRARMAGKRTVDPFFLAGIGMYHTSFGENETAIPDFYRRRLESGDNGFTRTFTDPSLVAGGGVSLFLSRHVAIRPDVEAAILFANGGSHVITTAAVHFVYHFESHPVTPSRR